MSKRIRLLKIDVIVQRGLMILFLVLGLRVLNGQDYQLALLFPLLFIGIWQFLGNVYHMDHTNNTNRKHYFLATISYFVGISLIIAIFSFTQDIEHSLMVIPPVILAISYYVISEVEYRSAKVKRKN